MMPVHRLIPAVATAALLSACDRSEPSPTRVQQVHEAFGTPAAPDSETGEDTIVDDFDDWEDWEETSDMDSGELECWELGADEAQEMEDLGDDLDPICVPDELG